MEPTIFRAAAVLAALNVLTLAWLWTTPEPPEALSWGELNMSLHTAADAVSPETPARTTAGLEALDGLLAARLSAEAAARGVEPSLPDAALRAEAVADGDPEGDAALRLLAAYERGFEALGLWMDELGR